MVFTTGLFIIGVILVYFGARFLIYSSVNLSRYLGISTLAIGLTVVALGTSAPELAVGIWSAVKGANTLSLGNIVGANLVNISLILGLAALINPIKVQTSSLRKEFPFVILAPLLLYILSLDGLITRVDGVILVIMAFLFIYYAIWSAGQGGSDGIIQSVRALKEYGELKSVGFQLLYLITSLVLLILGAKFLVDSGLIIAQALGMPKILIGITFITIGTTLPELATGIVASIKKQSEISLGNVLGSTVFNIFFIVGLVSIISPITLPSLFIKYDLLILIFFTLIAVSMLKTGYKLVKKEGAILLGGYIIYLIYSIWLR